LHLLTSLAVAVGLLAHAVVEGLLDAAVTGGGAGGVGGVVPELLRLDGEQLFVLHPLRRVDSVVVAGAAFGALRGRGRRGVAVDGGIGGGFLVLLVLLRLEGGGIAALEDMGNGVEGDRCVALPRPGCVHVVWQVPVGLESVLLPTSVPKFLFFVQEFGNYLKKK
jgi:hypothetical protein